MIALTIIVLLAVGLVAVAAAAVHYRAHAKAANEVNGVNGAAILKLPSAVDDGLDRIRDDVLARVDAKFEALGKWLPAELEKRAETALNGALERVLATVRVDVPAAAPPAPAADLTGQAEVVGDGSGQALPPVTPTPEAVVERAAEPAPAAKTTSAEQAAADIRERARVMLAQAQRIEDADRALKEALGST